jgi:hypothetical protein
MKVGDIVRLKEEHHLSTFLVGYCIVDDVRFDLFRRKFQIRVNRKNRYHIKTLNKNSDGSHSMTWIDEDEVISISEIRNLKLNELGI